MKDVRKIKGLNSQLKKMQGDYEALNIEFKNKQKELVQKEKAIKKLKDSISKINDNKTLKVSEHAILRYCERVMKLNVNQVENEILTDEIRNSVETLGGNGTYNSNGYKVIIKDYTVTTIV